MKINCVINGRTKEFEFDPARSLRELLVSDGHFCVRDSDDREGFAGSDTVVVDGIPVYANLMLAGEVDGCEIRTPDGLADGRRLSVVQQAMVDAGVVQSAYNAPAAALLLTWLLENNPDPSKEEIKDALSGIFIRDAGYEHYYLAVKLAREKIASGGLRARSPLSSVRSCPSSARSSRRLTGSACRRMEKLCRGSSRARCCALVLLRSPHPHAYITKIDISEAEKMPGVLTIITCENCPDVFYMQAGQGNPSRRRMTEGCSTGRSAMSGIEWQPWSPRPRSRPRPPATRSGWSTNCSSLCSLSRRAMASDAPQVHQRGRRISRRRPGESGRYNKTADPRDGKVIYQFPLHGDIRHNIAAAAHGKIGDVEKGFADGPMW
jgi:putative selenate reductase molybdopterin-binding subunit